MLTIWIALAASATPWTRHPVTSSMPVGPVYSADSVDWDGDGDLDVLAAEGVAGVGWYENVGGVLGPGLVVDTATSTRVSPADVNGDGDLDLVSIGGGAEIAVYDGLGGGVFGARTVVAALDALRVATGDLDGDGDTDLVATLADLRTVTLARDALGVYGPAVQLDDVCDDPTALLTMDSDGDGDDDVVSACAPQQTGGTQLWVSTTPGVYVRHAYQGAFDLEAVDSDQDGDPDLLGAFVNGVVRVKLNEGDAFTNGSEDRITSHDPRGVSAVLVDFDGDGDLDLARGGYAWDHHYGRFHVAENVGAGRFGVEQLLGEEEQFGDPLVSSADLDLDGDPDLVGAIDYYGCRVFRNDGGFLFSYTDEDGTCEEAIEAGPDMDGDGDPDVITADYSADRLGWSAVDGDQITTFTEASGLAMIFPTDAMAFDVDGDDDPDLVGVSKLDDHLAWFENLGGGVLGPGTLVSVAGNFATGVASLDYDGDGDLDLAMTSVGDEELAVHENTGAGFSTVHQVVSRSMIDVRDVLGVDLDQDGAVDLVASTDLRHLSWFRNLGGGAWAAEEILEDGDGGAFDVGDVDGDGDPDIVVPGYYTTFWLENPQNRLFTLGEVPPVTGVDVLVAVSGASPFAELRLVASTSGAPSVLGGGPCPGLALSMTGPKRLAAAAANDVGDVWFEVRLPAGASGQTLTFQAIDLATCTASTVTTATP